MKLLTRELMNTIPKLYSQEGLGDAAVVHVKFFTPWTSWTWYGTEATAYMHDGTERALSDVRDWQEVEDVRFFGLVEGHEAELGYFSLNELHSLNGPFGLKIERDKAWRPKTLAEIQKRRAA